jgi:hypothetical protein
MQSLRRAEQAERQAQLRLAVVAGVVVREIPEVLVGAVALRVHQGLAEC